MSYSTRNNYTYFTYKTLTTANPNKDGTGTLVNLLPTSGNSGTLIKSITIKAVGATTLGAIRFFVNYGTFTLLKEVPVPAVTPSAIVPTFSTVITFPDGFKSINGNILYASTENSEEFNIILECRTWQPISSGYINDMQYNAANSAIKVNTANPNRDGTGTLVPLFGPRSENGIIIRSVTITAESATTQGMIRFFIATNSLASKVLMQEIPIPATTPTGLVPAFSTVVNLPVLGFHLFANGIIYVSTEKSETFNICLDANCWTNTLISA